MLTFFIDTSLSFGLDEIDQELRCDIGNDYSPQVSMVMQQ